MDVRKEVDFVIKLIDCINYAKQQDVNFDMKNRKVSKIS